MRGWLVLALTLGPAGCGDSERRASGKPGPSAPVTSIFVVPRISRSFLGRRFSISRGRAISGARLPGAGAFHGFSESARQAHSRRVRGVARRSARRVFARGRGLRSLQRTARHRIASTYPAGCAHAGVEPRSSRSIDPSSPERGERKLVTWSFRKEAGVYAPSNLLAFMPPSRLSAAPHTRATPSS
jgi:hypothetical protein